MRPTPATTSALIAIALSALAGCDLQNPGVAVPPGVLNFPIALAIASPSADPAQRYLVVVNANSDLRYAAGTLQTYSIAAIDQAIAACPSRADAGGPSEACLLGDQEVRALLTDEVQIGSAADGIALGGINGVHDRIYVPVRSGRGVLTWVDIDDSGGLFCGGATNDAPADCDSLHASTDLTIGATRGFTLPTDPTAVAVVDIPGATEGEAIVLTHRGGIASLFLDVRSPDGSPGARPQFVHALGGVPFDSVNARADPRGRVWITTAGVAQGRTSRDLVALGVVYTSSPCASIESSECFQLAVVERRVLRAIDDGLDTRDIAFDPGSNGDVMYVAARRPEAVIEVDFRLPCDPPLCVPGEAPIAAIYPACFGPARIAPFTISAETRLAVTCYTGPSVGIIDPGVGLTANVSGFTGPFEIAIDERANRAYVSDYRFSVLWVMDLAPLASGGTPRLIARLGTGRAPSAL